MINSICILGGGTSGLVSALMIKKAWPDLNVTMIESSKYGIIGVGEGSTEHWKKFIDHVGISVPDLVRETGATFKMGIKFTNWHGDGTHYFHSLSEQYGPHSSVNGLPYIFMKLIGDNGDPVETAWSLSRESRHVEPLHEILSQYHFDTFKLNDYLHRVCKDRGINIIDTEIEDVVLDNTGFVKHLVDKDNQEYAFDFFVDCSGFKRVIGSKLGVKWIDCSAELPMNSAMAFPTDYTEAIPSYTESTALSSGWVWRIPTQERYGNGYVFCDEFINETQAYDEVQKYYRDNLGIDQELQIGRKVKFSAGYVDKFWIKNCAMIGLSSIFVEPLEASSIGTTIQQTFTLLPTLFFFERDDDLIANQYNKDITGIAKNIVDFIQLHYITNRDDTEFWRWAKNNIKLTEFNTQYLEHFKDNFVHPHFFNNPMHLFSHLNYIQVMHGLHLFNTEKIKRKYNHFMATGHDKLVQNLMEENDFYTTNVESFPHREALERIKQRFTNVVHKF